MIPLPDGETLAQWTCTNQLGGCASSIGAMQFRPYELIEPCPVDPTRPRSTADCASDEWFRCLPARTGNVVVAVNCECVPMLDAGCSCHVDRGFSIENTAVCHERDMMCGCAITGILVH
jgi:hypothetical protein